MADSVKAGMISGMPTLDVITGEEQLEVIKLQSDGTWKNYSLLVSKIRTNAGLSAYEVAVKNGFVGSEPEWLASLDGESAYALAVSKGFTGTEEEWLTSLNGESAYKVAVDQGYTGTEEDWLITLVGKSAYQVALDNGFVGTQVQWLASLVGEKGDKGDNLTLEGLKELLLSSGITLDANTLKALSENSGFVANGGYFNFLYLFDKRLGNADNSDPDKVPQYSAEMGRMEAEGYSYWKNTPATTSQGSELPDVPDSEIRLYDTGLFQIGSLTDYIEFGDSSKVTVVAAGVSTTYDLAAATAGKSAYDIAVDNGYVGTEAEWLASLEGKTAFQAAVDGGYTGTEDQFNQDLAQGRSKAGAVFVTAVAPATDADFAGNPTLSADGLTVTGFQATDGSTVAITVQAMTGPSSLRPVVTVGEQTVTFTQVGNTPFWTGVVNVVLPTIDTGVTLAFKHADGAEWDVAVTAVAKPIITSAVFTGSYPGTQTELKAGDTVNLTISANGPVTGYEIANEGALVASNGTVTATASVSVFGAVVANRGTTTTSVGAKVRVIAANGVKSDWYQTSTGGSVDHVNLVKLNNLFPTATINSITYPSGQTAIKSGDSATVATTIANYDTIQYTALGNQLSITNPNLGEANKTVTWAAGVYNDSTNNFEIVATRTANGAVTKADTVVRIANGLPTASVTLPAARLRSGGSNGTQVQRYVVTLTSDQTLKQAPSMNLPSGSWEAAAWVSDGTGKVWTRGLLVADTDAKGSFDFNSVQLTGLAGQVGNTLSSGGTYVLGGFVFRTLTVPAYPNRQVAIGTTVVDTTKLRCSNLSKGVSGSLNATYQSGQTDAVDKFTILTNDTWYNCDAANAVSNTSGTAKIELEEVV